MIPLSVVVACSGVLNLQPALDACYAQTGPCVIELSAGKCSINRTVELCPGVELSGVSEQHTQISTTGPFTAFRVLPFGECKTRSLPWQGNVRLERMKIIGRTQTSSASATHGVLAENFVRLRRLHIMHFVQGVRIDADARRTPAGNSNRWVMDDVHIQHSAHAGIFIDGGDVNAGLANLVSVSGPVCSNIPLWSHLGRCAGIVDDGFLGSVYIAPHVAGFVDMYRMTNRNARHVLVGPYSEGGVSFAESQTMALGGISTWTGRGFRQEGNVANGLTVTNAFDPTNVVQLELGGDTGIGGAFFAARAYSMAPNWPLRMKAEPARMCYRFDVANLGSAVPLRISAVPPLGRMSFNPSLFSVE